MKRLALFCACAGFVLAPSFTSAQSTADPVQANVPRLVNFNGQIATPAGEPRTGPALLTFGLYANQTGGTALSIEQHAVTLDAQGRYAVVLGTLTQDGLPQDVFVTGRGRWIGMGGEALHRPGTILGKALEAQLIGKGEILVLLALL